jgi:hypothetical protein
MGNEARVRGSVDDRAPEFTLPSLNGGFVS